MCAVMYVWLNGEFVDRDAAQVSIFDAGFQHGVGLFETMLARNGKIFRVESHLRRLANSAKELLLSERLRIEPLIEAVNLTLTRNELDQARVRLTITGGDLSASPGAGTGPITYGDPGQGEGHVVHIAHVGSARQNLAWARDLGLDTD